MDEKESMLIEKNGSDSEEIESETDDAGESNISELIQEARDALRILYEILGQKNKELVGFDRTFVEESIKSIESRIEYLNAFDC